MIPTRQQYNCAFKSFGKIDKAPCIMVLHGHLTDTDVSIEHLNVIDNQIVKDAIFSKRFAIKLEESKSFIDLVTALGFKAREDGNVITLVCITRWGKTTTEWLERLYRVVVDMKVESYHYMTREVLNLKNYIVEVEFI